MLYCKHLFLIVKLPAFPSGQRGQIQVLLRLCFVGSNPTAGKSCVQSVVPALSGIRFETGQDGEHG